uniref:Sister chromatid cohesion protein DCC1 n=1 Tax=Acrobeloides nanus TaxID=290746 RepID=A0A914D465_9BILA
MHLRGKDLVFDSPFTSADYFLIEVDKKLADDVLNGKELVVRGNVYDYVTICTEDTTYATKEVEISNTLLVAENLEPNMNMATCPKIISLHNTYIELKPTKFLLFHLKKVLFEMLDMYDFEEPEEPKNKVNFENLLNTIQMSAGELQEAIQKLPIIEDKGTLFMLSARSINKLLDDVIRLCDDDIYPDIAIEKITFEELREPLSELIPDSAIYWFLREFCDFNGKPIGIPTAQKITSYMQKSWKT